MNNFNINEFVNVVIPSILINLKEPYYVKGGKCYDIYFADKTNSPDFDLDVSQSFLDKFIEIIEDYAKNTGLKVIKKTGRFDDGEMTNVGFESYMFNNSPYFIDLIKKDINEEDYITINGINYLKLDKFTLDLFQTYVDREFKLRLLKENYETISRTIDGLRKKYKIDQSDLYDEMFEVIKNRFFKFKIIDKTYVVKELEKIKSTNSFSTFVNIDKQLNNLFEQIEEKYPKISSNDKWLETNSQILEDALNYKDHFEQIKSIEEPTKKLAKTKRRYDNIKKISWDSLSDEYKIYLTSQCISNNKDLTLFEIIDDSNEIKVQALAKCFNGNVEIATDTELFDKIKELTYAQGGKRPKSFKKFNVNRPVFGMRTKSLRRKSKINTRRKIKTRRKINTRRK